MNEMKPIIYRGFPSYEWTATQPLTMTGGQVYNSEKFHFLKN